MSDSRATGDEDGKEYVEGMNSALQLSRPTLSLLPSRSSIERDLIARRPVATCVADASAGKFWAFLDLQLLELLTTKVKGSPLVEVVCQGHHGANPAPSVLLGTARVITSGTSIAAIWDAPTGALERSYHESESADAQTWGHVITDRMYPWVSTWMKSVVGPCSRSRFTEIHDKVSDALVRISLSEWDWERSRRSMTVGQLRLAINQQSADSEPGT